MEDLARLVKTTHKLGMKIVPYTAPEEFHPEVPEFQRNVRQWRTQPVKNGGTVFHATGNYPGAIWGVLVCPDCKGVRRHYLNFAKKYVRNHGFDGIYTDLVSKVFCHNTEHGPALHGGMDGLLKVLTEMREFLGPDGLIISHNGDPNMLVAVSNLADNTLTMEAQNRLDDGPVGPGDGAAVHPRDGRLPHHDDPELPVVLEAVARLAGGDA